MKAQDSRRLQDEYTRLLQGLGTGAGAGAGAGAATG